MKDSELKKYLDITLYRILCVEKKSSLELMKSNLKGLRLLYHPDKNKGNEKIAHEKFVEATFAFDVLSDSSHQARYDILLEEHEKEKIRRRLNLIKEKPSAKMKTYLISYDLKTPGDYLELTETIRHFATFWHGLDSTWIIKTNLKSVEIRNKLSLHINKKDKLFVAHLSGESAWIGFASNYSEWLKSNL